MVSLYDVLKASKGLPQGDPIAGIWGRKLAGGKNQETEGTLPLIISANGENLIDYHIYGANGGVGEQTENLWDGDVAVAWLQTSSGSESVKYRTTGNNSTSICIPCLPSTIYSIKKFSDTNRLIIGAFVSKPTNDGAQGKLLFSSITSTEATITTLSDSAYIVFYIHNLLSYDEKATVVKSDTVPTSYIPCGYQLNVVVGDGTTETTTPIYIGDTPLEQGEYVDYGEQKVYKYVDGVLTPTDPPVALPALPTIDGTTVYDADLVTKPSKMYVKYRKH